MGLVSAPRSYKDRKLKPGSRFEPAHKSRLLVEKTGVFPCTPSIPPPPPPPPRPIPFFTIQMKTLPSRRSADQTLGLCQGTGQSVRERERERERGGGGGRKEKKERKKERKKETKQASKHTCEQANKLLPEAL